MVSPPFAGHSTMVLCFCGGPDFLHEHCQLWSSSLPSFQAVPSQPTAILSLGLLFKPHVPAPSPCVHQRTLISGWAMQGCGMDHLCRSHSVLPATDWLLSSPPSPRSSPSVPDLPVGEGASPDVGTSPHLQFPARGAGPVLLPLLFLFPSSFFHPTWLHGDLSCPFRCPRSSASVQQMFCENCSICTCILDVFVGRDKLQSSYSIFESPA